MKILRHVCRFLSATALVAHAAVAEIPAPSNVAAAPSDAEVSESGLASKVLITGIGNRHPGPRDTVKVHYSGWTTDGRLFDSSVERGAPISFALDRVIPGWTEGLQLMVTSEKRRLWIPEALAYRGRAGAPAGMLVFDVELLEIEGGSSESGGKAARPSESGGKADKASASGGEAARCRQAVRNFISNTNVKGMEIGREIAAEAEKSCENGDFDQARAILLSAPPPVAPTRIVSFVASNTKISRGDPVFLAWQTSNASSVEITTLTPAGTVAARFTVDPSGTRKFSPRKTTEFVLLASGSGKEPIERKLRVEVDLALKILRFTASPTVIRKGERSTLSWDVYDSDQVRLDDTDVGISGNKTVAPQRSTNYKLRAWAEELKVEELVRVSVSPFPRPRLSAPFKSVEICRELDTSGTNILCIGKDGPFYEGNEVHVIVRFQNLSPGRHRLKRILYSGGKHGASWRRIQDEESSFEHSRGGSGEAFVGVANVIDGFTKLEIVLDGNTSTKAEIIYCVESCRGYDEW